MGYAVRCHWSIVSLSLGCVLLSIVIFVTILDEVCIREYLWLGNYRSYKLSIFKDRIVNINKSLLPSKRVK